MTLRSDLLALAESYRGKGLDNFLYRLLELLARAQETGDLTGSSIVQDAANQRIQITQAGLYPSTDAKATQAVCGFYAGNGVPNNANGANGDFYLRGDGTVAGNTVIYHKQAGAWVALLVAT